MRIVAFLLFELVRAQQIARADPSEGGTLAATRAAASTPLVPNFVPTKLLGGEEVRAAASEGEVDVELPTATILGSSTSPSLAAASEENGLVAPIVPASTAPQKRELFLVAATVGAVVGAGIANHAHNQRLRDAQYNSGRVNGASVGSPPVQYVSQPVVSSNSGAPAPAATTTVIQTPANDDDDDDDDNTTLIALLVGLGLALLAGLGFCFWHTHRSKKSQVEMMQVRQMARAGRYGGGGYNYGYGYAPRTPHWGYAYY
mmetsp:Transcript_22986/g.58085  ORF Transcript_22986/g.58085 Transcript_22986/m.58085 type:complete len:259 (-) Transcript_22986:514-1290(-)